MAEVLGAISATLHIVELCEKLARRTKDIWNSEKDWEEFDAEIASLSNVLKQRSTSGPYFNQDNTSQNEALNRLRNLLLELESKVATKPTGIIQKLTWQYTKEDVQELFGAMERVKSQIVMQDTQ